AARGRSCRLPRSECGVDSVGDLRPAPSVGSGRTRFGEVVEIDQETETELHLLFIGQVAPPVALHVPSRKAVRQLALLYVCEDGLAGRELPLVRGAVDPMGVALEVFRESQGLQERGLRYRSVAGIGEMGHERERGYELAVLGKVPLEGGRQFGIPQAPLE